MTKKHIATALNKVHANQAPGTVVTEQLIFAD